MPPSSRLAAIAVALGLAAPVAFAGDARIPLPGSGSLVLPVPAGWRQGDRPGPVRTLSLTPENGGNEFHVLVSPLLIPGRPVPPADTESLRQLVRSGADHALPHAVEKSLPLQEFRSPGVEGSYFSATDRAPKPGEFKYMTQGAMAVQGLPVTFTILSNVDPKLAVEPALRMLKAARRE